MEQLGPWDTWERLALVVETVALVTGGITWWWSRLTLKRQFRTLKKQHQELVQRHDDAMRQHREVSDYMMRAICEPDADVRQHLMVYFERVINEPDEEKRQEYLDSIVVDLSTHFRAKGGGSSSLGTKIKNARR